MRTAFSNGIEGAKQIVTNAVSWFRNSGKKVITTLTLSGQRTMTTYAQGIENAQNVPAEATEKGLEKTKLSLEREPIKKVGFSSTSEDEESSTGSGGNDGSSAKQIIIQKLLIPVDAESKKEQLSVTLEFWEYIPQPIQATTSSSSSGSSGGSGSGSTAASTLSEDYKSYRRMKVKRNDVILLDGDQLRQLPFNKKSGYNTEDRRRGAFHNFEICKMLADQGIDVVLCSIFMYSDCRAWARKCIENYKEIYLKVAREALYRQDQKSLYSSGAKNVVGIDLLCEEPEHPDIAVCKCSSLW